MTIDRNTRRGRAPLGRRPDGDVVAVAEAEAEAETLRAAEPVLGTPGPPVNRRSPFMIGMLAAAGVAVTYGLVQFILVAANVLALIGLSLFLAVGLEPAVAWLTRLRMPRGVAVTIVALSIVGAVVGFLAAAIPMLSGQVRTFLQNGPVYVEQMSANSGVLRDLDQRFHLQDNVEHLVHGDNSINSGLLNAGRIVLTGTISTLTVLVVTLYLLVDLPRIRRQLYRLSPASRRARVILIGDEVSARVGRFVLGNLATSGIAGALTLVWLLAWRVPYPWLLVIMVAIFDLIPIVGFIVAGFIVTLVALTVSGPVAIATVVFLVAYKLAEDYIIVPRVIGRVVDVPASATLLAVLVGGATFGLQGALIAIPAAAAIDILLRQTAYPRLDRS
jgi:predicted PurR-regulated permease PerM